MRMGLSVPPPILETQGGQKWLGELARIRCKESCRSKAALGLGTRRHDCLEDARKTTGHPKLARPTRWNKRGQAHDLFVPETQTSLCLFSLSLSLSLSLSILHPFEHICSFFYLSASCHLSSSPVFRRPSRDNRPPLSPSPYRCRICTAVRIPGGKKQ
jgi:hypothetical protein